jgi:integrase
LFWHASGRWAKKIHQRFVYFGRGTHDEALAEYERQKDDLHSGRAPQQAPEGLTVYLLCAKFLTAKKEQRDNGELAGRTFQEYGEVCRRLQRMFGKDRLTSDLRPDDFAKLRAVMSRTWGPVRLSAEIVRTRVPFNWAYKSGLIDKPMIYAEAFNRPSKKTLRVHKAAQGPRMFEAAEIRRMLESATKPLRSMILLGVNCGYSNSDIGALPIKALDLEGGWARFARVKTGVPRKAKLWPETCEALTEWLTVRPEPADPKNAELVFVTSFGNPWTDGRHALSRVMRELLDQLNIDGRRTYYHLRHTLQTIGDECNDYLAVRHVMGHARSDIADVYRERMKDERLEKVAAYVRAWLFSENRSPTP